jgi:hypothetical protein
MRSAVPTAASFHRNILFSRARLCDKARPVRRKTMRALIIAALAAPALAGCVSTVKSVVTAPVKAVGQVADWSTTSQDEADRNRGRAMRAREERLGKLTRQRDKAAEKCRSGQENQCQRAEVLDHEIEAVMAEQI